MPRQDLLFYNGLGGFTPDGREYVITTAQGHRTPAPWVNVIANPHFGTVISESGLAYTWSENAHEFRLTPWGNDSINDSGGEAFYLRDEKSGYFWSPAPQPCGGDTPYVTRHGFGYTVFEHTERGIRSELHVYVALDAPVKFAVLKVANQSGRTRSISATGYVEWVLGDLHSKTGMYIVTERDVDSGAIFAHNPYNTEFPGRTAFFDTDDTSASISCDRAEFLGRNGTLESPAAMRRARLSGRVGAALDPCAAIQTTFELEKDQEREVVFRLGVGCDANDARSLAAGFCGTSAARGALEKIWLYWSGTLDAVRVETPDESFNVMLNGWILYQTLSCRMWARSGFYQSGGAFGFRDQLQDAMALIHTQPGLLREQLLLCASRQFPEGDVQHWWHPPTGRGVRSRCSDDYLWLPLAACRYVIATEDRGALDESSSFIDGRQLREDESSYYDLPSASEETATLYEHCVRAIRHGLEVGAHGLPLMGSGDWNDGMDRVGERGSGESVWLAFFMYDVLTQFAPIARKYGDASFAEQCITAAEGLRRSAEENGWDKEWYLRAYFDDGTPIGSSLSSECRIDSIAQSWSVLSGAGGEERSRMAMESLYTHLVRREEKLVQLLDPPFDIFDASSPNPGYIKGYAPGVRENGGQYTHAAVWAAMAFAKLRDKRRAWELFDIINPVNHGRTREEIAVYKAEPYVMAADVYASRDHAGRGGWSWYTGSASWMYRLMLESLLGIRLEGSTLHVAPCLPEDWKNVTIHYRYRETMYNIKIIQLSTDDRAAEMKVGDIANLGEIIPLVDDQEEHWVSIGV
jgi:cellobiose phosphorylase